VELDPLSEERVSWGDLRFDGVHPAIEHSLPSTCDVLASFAPHPRSWSWRYAEP
jgi:hypothetical protein